MVHYFVHYFSVTDLSVTHQTRMIFSFQTDRSPLHWAVSAGKREVVDFLVDHNARIDDKDDVSFDWHAQIYC